LWGQEQLSTTAVPVGLLIGYVVMGAVVYSMMVALGEMTTLFPVSGSFVRFFVVVAPFKI